MIKILLSQFSTVLLGLSFGLFVSTINYLLLQQGIKKGNQLSPHKATNIILMRYMFRYLLDIVALFIVHRNNMLLIATAVGLMGNKYYQTVRIWFKDYCSKRMDEEQCL